MRLSSCIPGILLGVALTLRPPLSLAQDPGTAAPPIQIQGRAGVLPHPTQPETGYTVTGHVTCADTQRPARFAQVFLIPATGTSGGFDRGRRSSGRTDLDGSFQITNVPTGDYFVTAALTGYVNDELAVVSALSAGSDTSSLHGVPVIHVSAGGTSAEVSLQRGSVVSGTAQWDDGTPAAGVQISAVPATSANASSPTSNRNFGGLGGGFISAGFFGQGATTDDRGRFRLPGLPAGAYLIRASVQAPAREQGNGRGFQRILNISVWAPDKVRRTEAATITLAAGEERGDLAITLGLARLHTVSGQVSASGASVRSGTVSFTDQTDTSLNRVGFIGADGSFAVTYVPAGTYTVTVTASSQANGGFGRGGSGGGDPSTRFQRFQESVTVADGDLPGLNITVTPATAGSQ